MIQIMAYHLVQTKRGARCVNSTFIEDFQFPDTHDFGFNIRGDLDGWRLFILAWRSPSGARLRPTTKDGVPLRYRVWRIGGKPSYEQLFPGKDVQGRRLLVSEHGYLVK